jgi:glycosyltransferase involved in cell wall biosynthesis
LDGLGIRPPFLLSASTLEPRKNLRRLVAAYSIARPQFPEPWPLLIVGPSGWGARSRTGIHHPSALLPDGVFLVGHVQDAELAGLYEAARVFAYVPLSEGYGLPPVEAMSFGVPVVASTGVPSVYSIGTEPAAFMVAPTSVEEIASALVEAAVNETRRVEVIRRGTALAAERRWTNTVRCHLDVWESLG